MIRLKGVTKIYQSGEITVRAVDGVDLNVEAGEMVLITGRSGSGKTTLLSLIGGLTRPTSGRVWVDGIELGSLNDKELSLIRNKKIGFMFQFASLISTLTAIDNVRLPVIFGRGEHQESRQRAEELLLKMNLSDKMISYPSQLSGGEQRRAAIARALMNEPEIILADEPTGDLDQETEDEVMQFFQEVNKQGITLVVVTHNPELSAFTGAHYILSKGTLTQVK